jgi:hypothetical protein
MPAAGADAALFEAAGAAEAGIGFEVTSSSARAAEANGERMAFMGVPA